MIRKYLCDVPVIRSVFKQMKFVDAASFHKLVLASVVAGGGSVSDSSPGGCFASRVMDVQLDNGDGLGSITGVEKTALTSVDTTMSPWRVRSGKSLSLLRSGSALISPRPF